MTAPQTIQVNEGGFTMQELLVSLIVGSLVISFCMSLFLFADRSFLRWQKNLKERDLANHTLQLIVRDVQRSSDINNQTNASLSLRIGGSRLINYSFDGTGIRRGDISIFDGNVECETRIVLPKDEKEGHIYQALDVKISTGVPSHHYEAAAMIDLPYSGRQEFERSSISVR